MTWEELIASPKLFAFSKNWAGKTSIAPQTWPNSSQPLFWSELAPMIGARASVALRMYQMELDLPRRISWKPTHTKLRRGIALADELLEIWTDREFASDMMLLHRQEFLSDDYNMIFENVYAKIEANRDYVRQMRTEIVSRLQQFEHELPARKKRAKKFSSAKFRCTQHLIRGAIEIWTGPLQKQLGEETPVVLMQLFGELRDLAGCKPVNPPELYRLIREARQ